MKFYLNEFALYAQIVTGIIGIIALLFSVYQLKIARLNKRFDFILKLRDFFNEEKKYLIHIDLRNGNKIKDWPSLDDYLGMFEVCEVMMRNKLLDEAIFIELYKYRLVNIIGSDEVLFNKFILEFDSWKNLYALYIRTFPELKQEFISIQNISPYICNSIGKNYINTETFFEDFIGKCDPSGKLKTSISNIKEFLLDYENEGL